jgi:hypothetical protein
MIRSLGENILVDQRVVKLLQAEHVSS